MTNKYLPDGPVPHVDRPEGLHAGCECGDATPQFADPFKNGFTRRKVLAGSTAFAAGLAVQPFSARYAFGAPAPAAAGRVLINIVLAGGLDGLTWAPPLGNAEYARRRPNTRETAQTAFQLDGQMGLLNEFRQLRTTLGAGNFGIAPACVSMDRTHSHFDARDLLDGGQNTVSSDGWAGRALQRLPNRPVLSAVMVGNSLPKSLAGGAALTLDRIESFGLAGGDEVKARSEAALQKFYTQYKDPVATTATETLKAIKTVRGLNQAAYKPAAQYPNGGLADGLKTTAQLIKARVGLRFGTLEVGGFDTHSAQRGQLHDHATEFANALTAFFADLGPQLRQSVSVVTYSEFGRTAGENGAQGTDHGHGQNMFVLGGGSTGGVRGGYPIFGRSGFDQEVSGTTDYRDVLTEALTWLGVPSSAGVFPGHKAKAVGSFRK